jgi:autotransporter translocation and assembly factor TamB
VTRRRIAIVFVPALLLMLVAGVFAWLMHSEPGARWILQRVASAVPGQLTHDRLSGDLQSGLRVTGLRYRDEGLSVEADWIELDLSLDFWPPAVAVHRLEFGQVDLISQGDPGSSAPVNLGDVLPLLSLPLPIEIERLRGERLAWSEPAAGSVLEFRDLFLSGFWFRALELRELRVTQGESDWAGKLEFDFQPPHGLVLSLRGSVVEPELLQSDTPLVLEARGSGDLGRSRWELEVADPQLAISGEVRDLLGTPAWDLQLEAGHLQWPLSGRGPSITGADVTGNSYGTGTEYAFAGSYRGGWQSGRAGFRTDRRQRRGHPAPGLRPTRLAGGAGRPRRVGCGAPGSGFLDGSLGRCRTLAGPLATIVVRPGAWIRTRGGHGCRHP